MNSGVSLAEDGLATALRSAVQANPQVKGKLAELEALGLHVDEARAGWYPTLSAEARTMDEGSSKGLLRVQQPVWTFGRIEGGIDLAKRQQASGIQDLLELRRSLIEETAAAYANLHGTHQRIAVAEANVSEHTALFELIRRRYQGGLASEADVRLASSRLAQTRATREQLQGQLVKSRQDLLTYAQVSLEGREPPPDLAKQLNALGDWEVQLDSRHAGVLARLERVEVVRLEGALRKAELMPTLSARLDREIDQPSTATVDATRFGLVLEGRIEGAGVAGRKRLAAELARLHAAREDVEAMRNSARQRVKNLFTDRRVQHELIDVQEEVVQSVAETLASFMRQYDAGRKTWVDVLNTQRELSDARQQLEVVRTSWFELSLRAAALLGLLDDMAGLER